MSVTRGAAVREWCRIVVLGSCQAPTTCRTQTARCSTRYPRAAGSSPCGLRAASCSFVDAAGRSYDITSDGQKLYVIKQPNPPDGSRINVITNWRRQR